jgi:hypothetical protein
MTCHKCPDHFRHPIIASQMSQLSQAPRTPTKIPLQQLTLSTQLIQYNTQKGISEECRTASIETLTIEGYLCYYEVGKTDNKVV